MPPVSLEEVEQARERLRDVALRTPLQLFLGDVPNGNTLHLKAENLQRTASFKFRGAYNAMAGLTEAQRSAGVITYSSGNHGQAVACAASLLGIKALVVMPEDALQTKVDLTRRWGAAVQFAGTTSGARQERALELAEQKGYAVIPPFDDRRIIAGQGTVGLEILEQLPDVEAVLVQVGGGGLISGIATAIRLQRPEVRIIGVEPQGAADAKASLESRSLVNLDQIHTVADGLRTSHLGALNFGTILELVDEIVTVSDEEILKTVGILANQAKLIVEPSGAVSTAAVLFGRCELRDCRLVSVLSGGNAGTESMISALQSEEREPAEVS